VSTDWSSRKILPIYSTATDCSLEKSTQPIEFGHD
jgi:hypothetical protein